MGQLHNLLESRNPLQKTIGKGAVGPKTHTLRADRKAIENAGFIYPDHASFTPSFFSRFLWESGALKESDPKKAKERILSGEFCPAEKIEVREAILSFDPLIRFDLMVRSDDYPRGVGLWHTGPASVRFQDIGDFDNIETLAVKVEQQMKEVLASDFNDDVRAFKKKKGLASNPGVILMPLFGEEKSGFNEVGRYVPIKVPPISINYLGDGGMYALWSIGAGIGGANSKWAMRHVGGSVPFEKFYCGGSFCVAEALERGGGLIKVDLFDLARALEKFADLGDLWTELEQMIRNLTASCGPRYLEIVKDDVIRPIWVVVQSAPVSVEKPEKPEIEDSRILMKTGRVCGSAMVRTSKIRRAGQKPNGDDAEFNANNKDYLLIVNGPSASVLESWWPISSFSNASVIVILEADSCFPFASHLNGYLRELGIPVLGGSMRGDLLLSLRKNPVQDIRSIVYANDFEMEGYVALDKG